MDLLDRRILHLVQRNASLTADQLAEEIPLSPSAITRRLKRLREEGIIAGEAVIIGTRLREERVTAIISIQLDHHNYEGAASLRRMMIEAPEVQICLEMTGSADMLLIASARDMAHFNQFADRLGSHPIVRRYESSIARRHIKMSLAVNLLDE